MLLPGFSDNPYLVSRCESGLNRITAHAKRSIPGRKKWDFPEICRRIGNTDQPTIHITRYNSLLHGGYGFSITER